MEKTGKIQIVYTGPTNLCQHSTTDLARVMTNERKQSVLSKARSFKHSKTTCRFFIQFITNEQVKSVFHMSGVDFMHVNT